MMTMKNLIITFSILISTFFAGAKPKSFSSSVHVSYTYVISISNDYGANAACCWKTVSTSSSAFPNLRINSSSGTNSPSVNGTSSSSCSNSSSSQSNLSSSNEINSRRRQLKKLINSIKELPVNNQVFISYSSVDSEIVKKLAYTLKRNKIKAWAYEGSRRNNQIGILRELEKTIKSSDAVIIVLSKKWRKSKYCRDEFEYAYELNKSIFTLRIEKTAPVLGLTNKVFFDIS
jgi:TIR domain-containing protein